MRGRSRGESGIQRSTLRRRASVGWRVCGHRKGDATTL
jgi:hypothetical protein